MSRTTPDHVRKVIPVDEGENIDRFIVTANSLTNHVASKDTTGMVSTELLLEIETYLAAHFYALFNPQVQSETMGASAQFQGQTGKGLEGTWWGCNAISLDVSGTLAQVAKGVVKGGFIWLGKKPRQQRNYWDQN